MGLVLLFVGGVLPILWLGALSFILLTLAVLYHFACLCIVDKQFESQIAEAPWLLFACQMVLPVACVAGNDNGRLPRGGGIRNGADVDFR
jgi:hypothetical protein